MLFTKVHEYFADKNGVMPTETEMQRKLLALLESKKWDVRRAASHLGISRVSLYRIIRDRPNLARALIKGRAEQRLSKVS